MSRRIAVAAALVAATLVPAGCVSWPDAANGEALAACERVSEPDSRRKCRTDVVTAAEAGHRAEMDRLGERILEAEARERADKVYGGPSAAGRN